MGPGVEPFYAQILRGGSSRRDDLGTEFFCLLGSVNGGRIGGPRFACGTMNLVP